MTSKLDEGKQHGGVKKSFKRVKKYHVTLLQNFHPGVVKYIQETISSMRDSFSKGVIKQFIILVKNGDLVKEKIMVEVVNIDFERICTDPYLIDLEQSFRAMFLKLKQKSEM